MRTARIPKSYVPEVEKPLDSAPEGRLFPSCCLLYALPNSFNSVDAEAEKNKTKTDEEARPNIRVSSTPRPRAVISSPGNYI